MAFNREMIDDGEIGYQIISLVRNADSQDTFKEKVLCSLCRGLGCRSISIAIQYADMTRIWTVGMLPTSACTFSMVNESRAFFEKPENGLPPFEWFEPLEIDGTTNGKVFFSPGDGIVFGDADRTTISNIVGILGQAIAFRMSQAALRERVKEITCLYEITKIMHQSRSDLEQTLLDVVAVIPGAFQFPDHARACIRLYDRIYGCDRSLQGTQTLRSDIVISGRTEGCLMVRYDESSWIPKDRSFLKEEQDLLNGIASQLSLLIDERESENKRRILEEQLRHADRLATLGQLAAGVAHDINEPLASILGFAELLKKTEGLPEQAGKDVDKIIRSSVYARDIVRKLLTFTGKITESTCVFDLNETIREAVQFFDSRCRNQNIDIISDLSPEALRIQADPGQINQVLINLIVNAIQVLPDGGRIEITSRRDGDDIVFDILDNGTGIDPEVRKNIFLPFFTTKERGKGTGLGLATVLGIVNSYGGEIDVDSEPGEYARFTVRLPGLNNKHE